MSALAKFSVAAFALAAGMAGAQAGEPAEKKAYALAPAGQESGGEHCYAIELKPEMCGKLDYRIRAHPQHPLLTHPFETGLMLWI